MTFEGSPPYQAKQPSVTKSTWEPILEATQTKFSISERDVEEPIGPWEPLELDQEEIIEKTPIVLALRDEIANEL